jgi:hypothetical protein
MRRKCSFRIEGCRGYYVAAVSIRTRTQGHIDRYIYSLDKVTQHSRIFERLLVQRDRTGKAG